MRIAASGVFSTLHNGELLLENVILTLSQCPLFAQSRPSLYLYLESALFNLDLRLQVKRVSYFILSTALVHIRSVTLWTKARRRQYQHTDEAVIK